MTEEKNYNDDHYDGNDVRKYQNIENGDNWNWISTSVVTVRVTLKLIDTFLCREAEKDTNGGYRPGLSAS